VSEPALMVAMAAGPSLSSVAIGNWGQRPRLQGTHAFPGAPSGRALPTMVFRLIRDVSELLWQRRPAGPSLFLVLGNFEMFDHFFDLVDEAGCAGSVYDTMIKGQGQRDDFGRSLFLFGAQHRVMG
jgi:hypothetical protein